MHEILGQRDSALRYVDLAFDNGATPVDIERSIWLDELRGDSLYYARTEGFRDRDVVTPD